MAFDPDNPTFYGESYPVSDGRDVTGTAIASKATGLTNGAAVTYLYDDDFVQGADAGDSMLFGVYPDWQYLEADSDVVFSVVVELAGGSGTFRLSAGSDPDWNLTSPALCTEDLGTFSASVGQVVADVEGAWSASLFRSGSAQPLIYLEVLTGSVSIRQIRVRAWPPGGVAGAWVADPDFEFEGTPRFSQSTGAIQVTSTAPTPQSYQSTGPQAYFPGPGVYGGFDDYGDTEGSFGAMVAAMAAAPLPTYQAFDYADHYDGGINGRFLYQWAVHSGSPAHDWTGKYELGMVLLMFQPEVVSTRQAGSTNFTDPDRIPWESAASVRDGATGGTLQSDFGGWTVNPTIGASGVDTDHIGVRVFTLDEPDWDQAGSDFLGGRFYRFYYDAAGIASAIGSAPSPDATELDLPDVPVVGIEVAPRMIDVPPASLSEFTFQDNPGSGSFSTAYRGVGYDVTRLRHVFDNVQYFDPAAAPAYRPRFFVKHQDDSMRPVGFGKPPTELTVFRVPGGGRWRDLTTTEYATYGPGSRPPGGVALKVKRLDAGGSAWWDHVGWMVPD